MCFVEAPPPELQFSPFRFRHKQVPVLESGDNMNHAHDWVWLSHEADLLSDHSDHCQPSLPDECTTIIDKSEGGYEENKYLLNGASSTLVMGMGMGTCIGTISRGGGTVGRCGIAQGQTLPRSVPESHQCLSAITTSGKEATNHPKHLGSSPHASLAAKRKHVQFTIPPNDSSGASGAYSNTTNGNEDDIKWVCQDMDLGQSEIKTYMERLQDNL